MRKRGLRLERAEEMTTSPSMRPVAACGAGETGAGAARVGDDSGRTANSPQRAKARGAKEWDTVIRDESDGHAALGAGSSCCPARCRGMFGAPPFRSAHGHPRPAYRRLYREAEGVRAADPRAHPGGRARRLPGGGGDAQVELAALHVQGLDDGG